MLEGMVNLTADDTLVKDGLVFDILSQDGNTGTLSVLAGSEELFGELNIPGAIEYKGVLYRVVCIAHCAFADCENLTKVMIPDGVTRIGDCAFASCENLTSIMIPNSVTEIGDGAFVSCCSLTAITIPASVIKMGMGVFKGCFNLIDITIPRSVTSIGVKAFEDCGSLKYISVSPDNPSYSSVDGVLFDKDKIQLIRYPAGKEGNIYSIPGSVTVIGEDAFSECESLQSVTIPDSVTKIKAWAFHSCSNLKSITIPDGVTSIEDNVFSFCKGLTRIIISASVTEIGDWGLRECSSLKNISVSPDNPSYSSVEGVLFNKDKTVLIKYPIGKEGSTYTVPDSVTEIKKWAFGGCESLKTITLSNRLTSIKACAFCSCSNLKNIMIPDRVRKIGSGAFGFCDSLTTITIPASVTEIGNDAFNCCNNLMNISVSLDNPCYSSEDGVLFNKDKTKLILYPPKKVGNAYSIPGSVTEIAGWAFAECRNLTVITIPDYVIKIGDCAFDHCDALSAIVIPDGIAKIGNYTFRCRSLTSISIPASLTEIEERAFNGCDSLKSISVSPDNPSYSTVDGVLFNKDKTRLIRYPAGKEENTYDIPGCVTEIVEAAFEKCRNLRAITIPDSVTEIGDWTFAKCKGLRTITIPDGVMIGIDAFLFCFGLERVYYKGRVLEPVDGESIYTGTPETLISYYPKGDSCWEKAIKDGRWQDRRAEPWEPDSQE